MIVHLSVVQPTDWTRAVGCGVPMPRYAFPIPSVEPMPIPGILQETSKITSTSTGVPSGIYKRRVLDKADGLEKGFVTAAGSTSVARTALIDRLVARRMHEERDFFSFHLRESGTPPTTA